MKLSPFKLKKEFIEDYKVLNLAQEIFGRPSDGISYHSGVVPKQTASWRFYGNTSVCYLSISHKLNDEFVGIEFLENNFSEDNTICVNINEFIPDWKDKFKKFIQIISKPWSDWEEKEIISSPMWIYYFWRENRTMPDQYCNAMVMFSYENPDNLWVKRYFDEQNKNQKD